MKRVLEVDEDEFEIIKESMDFLLSTCDIKNPRINYRKFYALFDRVYYKNFENLPQVKEANIIDVE